jgi:hypothetical protein
MRVYSVRYFAFVALAGGLCDMSSWVGSRGFLTGMLSGLAALAAPEAAAGGGLTIGAPGACGATVWPHAICARPDDAASNMAPPSDAHAWRLKLVFIGIIAISVQVFSGCRQARASPPHRASFFAGLSPNAHSRRNGRLRSRNGSGNRGWKC